MNILLIGGAGFVGTYLAEYFRDAGHNVWVTKIPGSGFSLPGVGVLCVDILNTADIETAFEETSPDGIFNLAAQSSVAISWEKPALTADVNIKGCVNLLETARKFGGSPKIILIGSGEEYGVLSPEDMPVREEKPLNPANIYAATKACQENLGKIYAAAYGMDIVSTRSFNHFGPRQSDRFVVSSFCKQAAEIEKGLKEPVMNVGNLSVKRDFLDVRDVVAAYSLLLEKGRKGEVYNVGSGKALEIKSLLDIILSRTNKEIIVNIDKSKFRPADVPLIEADVSKLKKDTGWEAAISMEQTVEDTLGWWRNTVKI